MRLYIDTSVLVALIIADAHSSRAADLIRGTQHPIVSDLAIAEFASALSRRVRMRTLLPADGRTALADLDAWLARGVERVDTTSADIRLAETYLRRLEQSLRPPDAIHIATARRIGVRIGTFDGIMAAAALELGVAVLDS